MKILIATPVRGEVPVQYINSFLETMFALSNAGHETVLMLDQLDNLQLSRNRCAKACLDQGHDKLIFIDSDIIWRGTDVLELLRSKREVVGGTYPFKNLPLKVNFHPKIKVPPGSLMHFADYVLQYSDENGELECDRLPTGFLMIDRVVLEKLEKQVPRYRQIEPSTGKEYYYSDFFPCGIQPVGEGVNDCETEDWGFCRVVKLAGFGIYLRGKVLVDHLGPYRYSVKQ